MPKVDNSGDFIFWFAEEISIKILTYLDDPSDVVRVSSVSKLWRQFVIEHDICKQLCLKKFPEISGAVELNNLIEPVDIGLRNGTEFELLKRNHKIFSFLAKALSPVITNDCLSTAISASSTDNYPTESIVHTLQPGDRNQNVASYWSSSGQHEPSVPETLLYELVTKMCLVSEIHVQPFQAYFQHRYPIYSCKAVRFKMGHLRNLGESDTDFSDNESEDHTLLDDRFVWTYISPEFPMVQEIE
uniref:F-box domain-containing protein n=1 Tax=Cannabis sativa TaxID=3483 RepID=A0A803PS48_CANSA